MRACDYHIYRMYYETTYAERTSTFGGMDSELTGKYITEERTYLCVAPSQAFAAIAFNRYHINDKWLRTEDLGSLDDIVYLQ